MSRTFQRTKDLGTTRDAFSGKMASSKKKDKRDKSKNKPIEYSLDTLSKCKHGLACVANIDVRGNVSIYALFKSSKNEDKPLFHFASMVGYVGGEFRDGFSQEDLEHSEAVRFMQSQVSTLEEKRIRVAFGPVEDVAGLFLLPLYTKSIKKGFGFPDTETAGAFEYFKRAAQYCHYSSPEDCFRSKLRSLSGRDITKARDTVSNEIDWSIDEVEIEFHKCPFPPDPPNWPAASGFGSILECRVIPEMWEQATWVIKAYQDCETWKKTAAKKLTTPDNYERFSGMAKQQALWYIWKGELEKAAVMVHSWRRLEDDWKKGNVLDTKNPAIEVILNTTHNDLSNAGLYHGYSKPDARLLRESKCDVCSSPGYEINLDAIRDRYGRTCVDREGKAELGTEEVRDNMVKLLFAIFTFGSNHDFETSATHCFKEALHVFLAHSFNNFYWRIKPTKPMKDATEAEAIPGIVKLLSDKAKRELDLSTFPSSCESILKAAMLRHCSSKLGEDQISSVCCQFRSRVGLIVFEFHKMSAEETNDKADGGKNPKDVGVDLLSKTMVPSFASEFQGKWTLLPEAKRQKILTTDSKALIKTCNRTFEKVKKLYTRQMKNCLNQDAEDKTVAQSNLTSEDSCGKEKHPDSAENCSEPAVESKQNSENDHIPEVCSDDFCPCKDPEKFYKHFVAILSSDKNPVPFYKCSPTGDVILNEEMCLDQDGNNTERMLALDFEYVNTKMSSINLEEFSSCPRLALLCDKACQDIYPLMIMSLCQGFVELQKKDNSKADFQICPTCGQKELKPGEFKRCGGCKNVYYCSRKCQVQDWKAGHKQQCGSTAKQA